MCDVVWTCAECIHDPLLKKRYKTKVNGTPIDDTCPQDVLREANGTWSRELNEFGVPIDCDEISGRQMYRVLKAPDGRNAETPAGLVLNQSFTCPVCKNVTRCHKKCEKLSCEEAKIASRPGKFVVEGVRKVIRETLNCSGTGRPTTSGECYWTEDCTKARRVCGGKGNNCSWTLDEDRSRDLCTPKKLYCPGSVTNDCCPFENAYPAKVGDLSSDCLVAFKGLASVHQANASCRNLSWPSGSNAMLPQSRLAKMESKEEMQQAVGSINALEGNTCNDRSTSYWIDEPCEGNEHYLKVANDQLESMTCFNDTFFTISCVGPIFPPWHKSENLSYICRTGRVKHWSD